MLKKIENELKKMYTSSDFKVVEQNDNIEIFYSDKLLKDNEKFMDDVFDVCEMYLNEDDLWKITVLYDYLNEIGTSCEEPNQYIKSKYSYTQNSNSIIKKINNVNIEKNIFQTQKKTSFIIDDFSYNYDIKTRLAIENIKEVIEFDNEDITIPIRETTYHNNEFKHNKTYLN